MVIRHLQPCNLQPMREKESVSDLIMHQSLHGRITPVFLHDFSSQRSFPRKSLCVVLELFFVRSNQQKRSPNLALR